MISDTFPAPDQGASPFDTSDSAFRAGLYLHIPFCLTKCPYCDFYSETDLSGKTGYLDALIAEMALTSKNAPSFDTIYFGGGTPSLLTGDEVDGLLSAAHTFYRIRPGAEITLEINPGTAAPEALQAYRRAGVNRITVGVQSFNDRYLKNLGRIHTARQASTCLNDVHDAGFDQVGIDLMYGLPGQTLKAWNEDLAQAMSFGPSHISCYMLTYETGTLLDTKRLDGQLQPLGDATVARMYKHTVRTLHREGYHQYEVSNFCRPGAFSRHNIKYWKDASYIGLGAGAHSYNGTHRYCNVKNNDRYVRLLLNGQLAVAENEKLDRKQAMLEALFLGLRTTAGIETRSFDLRFGVVFDSLFANEVADLIIKRLARYDRKRLALTVDGMLLLDAIVVQLAEKLDDKDNH